MTHEAPQNCEKPIIKLKATPKKRVKSIEITEETVVSLKKLETQLTGEDLGKISRSEALSFAKDKLAIKSPLDFIEFKAEINAYQKAQGLKETGVIDKDTYMEIKTGDVEKKLTSEIIKNSISQNTQTEILYILKESNLSTKNSIKLQFLLKNFKDNHKKDANFTAKYGAFYRDAEYLINDFNKTEKGKVAIDKAEKKSDTLYDMAKKGDIEGIIKDPTLLLAGGLLFLFGVFGGGTKYTDSVWKRLGIVIGGAFFGKPLLDKIGGSQIYDDLKGAGKSVAERVENSDMSAFKLSVPDSVKNLGKSITGAKDDLSSKIGESYAKVMGSLETQNEVNKKKNPEQYINNFSDLSGAINKDDTFMNKKLEKLEGAKGDADKIKELLSDETKGKLFPGTHNAKQETERKKDLINYVNVILNKKDGTEVYIKELFIEKDVLSNLKSTLAEQNVGYIKNNVLNEKIKVIIGDIDNQQIKESLIYELANIGYKEESNNRDNRDKIQNFLLKNPNISNEDKTKIDIIQNIFLSEVVLEEAIKKINNIKLEEAKTASDSLSSIDKKFASLEKIKSDFNSNTYRIAGSDNSEFESAYITKKLELFKKGAELENNPEGKYSKELKEIAEKQKELKEVEEKKLKELKDIENEKEYKTKLEKLAREIPAVPSIEAKPIEFKAFYDKYFAKFEEVGTIEKKSKDSGTKDLAKEILLKEASFKTNYEAVKKKYIDNLSKLEGEISEIKVDNTVDIETTKNQIKKKEEEYKNILKDIVDIDINSILDNAESFISQINTPVIMVKIKDNSFTKLDKALGITGDKVDLKLNEVLKTQLEILEGNYKITEFNESDFYDPNAKTVNEIKLKEIVTSLQKDHSIVATFDTDKKQEKIKSIEQESKKIRDVFSGLIDSIDDTKKLKDIYKVYTETVQVNLGGYLNNNTSHIENWKAYFNINGADQIKTKYEEKIKAIEFEEFGKKKVADVFNINKELFNPYMNFFNKYSDYTRIQDDGPKLMKDPNLTIKEFLAKLNIYTTFPQSELKDKSGSIISDIKFNGVESAYDGFNKNAKDMIENIKNNITNK